MTGGIEVRPVGSKAELERFVRVPMRLNAGDPAWRSPLIMERMEALEAKTNPFFEHADVQLWLAVRDGRDVGRISAQIDHLAPVDPADPYGYFGCIAAEDDPAVFAALFAAAEAWLRERGRTTARGPFSLSINEETGLLVEGFDTPPMVMMPHDPPYAGARVEEQGYARIKDLYAFLVDVTEPLPRRVKERLAKSPPAGVVLRKLDFKHYDREVAAMTSIINEGWSGNWGATPITEAETRALAKSMRPIIKENLVWFAEIDGEAAAFGVCLPNLNEAIRDIGGKLLPFGWAKLLWRLKVAGVKTGRVPLMGVKRKFARDFRGMMAPFMLIEAMSREADRTGMKKVELSWILEDNKPMRAIIDAVNSDRYKTYRLYEKRL